MKGYEQRVSEATKWLTDNGEVERHFWKVAYLPKGMAYAECTDKEKVAWEEAHKPVEPIDEIQEAEVVQ